MQGKGLFKRVLLTLAAIMLLAGVGAWLFLRDEPVPPAPEWAKPIERDPEAVAAVDALFDVETAFEALEEDEQHRLSLGAIGWDSPSDWSAIKKVLDQDAEALRHLHKVLSENEKLTFRKETDRMFAENSPVNRILKLVALMKMDMGLAIHEGRLDDGLRIALESLDLARRLCKGQGTMLHFVISSTAYQLALVNVYVAVMALQNDADSLKSVPGKLESLKPSDADFVNSVIAEYEHGEAVKEQPWEFEWLNNMTDLGFEDVSGRLFWVRPDWFYKENQGQRLENETNAELIRNAYLPTERWGDEVLERLLSVEGNEILNQVHPNAIGYLSCWQGHVLYSQFLRNYRRSRLILGLIQAAAAVRAYELEEESLPGRLVNLVPKYLEAVPLDPFNERQVEFDRKRRLVTGFGSEDSIVGDPVRHPFADPSNPTFVIPDGSWEMEDSSEENDQ